MSHGQKEKNTQRKELDLFWFISGLLYIESALITSKSPEMFIASYLSLPYFSSPSPSSFFPLLTLPVISPLSSNLRFMCHAGRLFCNQVRIAGIDWQAAVSIDSPITPINQAACRGIRPGRDGRRRGRGGGGGGADRFKRPKIHRSWLSPPSDRKINLLKSIWQPMLHFSAEEIWAPRIIISSY